MSAADIFKDNPYEVEFTVTKRSTTAGAVIPANGITDLRAIFSTTPEGAAIHAELDVLLTERSGKAGTYFAIIPTSVVNARLFDVAASLANQTIYITAKNADIEAFAKVKAKPTRPIT